MYKYLTESIKYTIRKNIFQELQMTLDKRASEGWRLVKYEFSDWLGYCVIVFEKKTD